GRHDITRVYFKLTKIQEESTQLLFYGEGSQQMPEIAFERKPDGDTFSLQCVVSRKKQLIPAMMEAAQLMNSDYA
ncbi:DHHA2 domain-containing protein, partial [Blautia sp. DFI.9.10]|uniref:DHHA2 domain-containing protein n=1 Tax=Blautia sp. DFI.9.10 TaxID=2965276 RepID=UPI002ED65AB9|nr:inorganic diphosphatase [Blautia sp. DFI.9.10]